MQPAEHGRRLDVLALAPPGADLHEVVLHSEGGGHRYEELVGDDGQEVLQ